MRPSTIFAVGFLSVLLAGSAAGQLKDRPGYKDPELFTRLPNFYLSNVGAVDEKQFNFYEFYTGARPADRKRVEGKYAKYTYTYDPAAGPRPSGLQVIRNYQQAAAKIGGKTVFEDNLGRRTTLSISRGGAETWVEAYGTGGNTYWLTIVEQQVMKQDVAANAAALQSVLAGSGHVEVPGIFFDFGKSEVKPESNAALQEVARMLQGSPALKVWVVGHTDNVGSADANLKLSGDRAAAVIAILSQKMGVDARRLAPFGAGPFAPVASNANEDGRAKNRRVELVVQP